MSGMRRREFISLLGGAAAAWPLAARAQQADRIPVVGFLNAASREGIPEFVAAFRQGLKEIGFVDGQNVTIEYRWAEGRNDRLPALAADLVRRQVAVIVANSPGVLPAKAETATIPIVFLSPGDPVAQGFVTSLNRPGGNVTGVSFFNTTLGSKRLELLHQMVPRAATIAFLVNPSFPTAEIDLQDTQAAARTLALRLLVLHAASESEIETVFASLAQQKPDALIVNPDPYLTSRRHQIVPLLARLSMPSAHSPRDWVVSGALMSYGTNTVDALSSGRRLCRRREARRPAGHAADQVRVGDQSQNREGAGPRGAGQAAGARRRGDRVKRVMMSANGTKRTCRDGC
jgi:putative tryptophan/tyrosine transport system substrate-binding protein